MRPGDFKMIKRKIGAVCGAALLLAAAVAVVVGHTGEPGVEHLHQRIRRA